MATHETQTRLNLVFDSFRCSFGSARSFSRCFASSQNIVVIMAFFGLTYMGYQNPFGDRMTHNKLDQRGMVAFTQALSTNTSVYLQYWVSEVQLVWFFLSDSSDLHFGIQSRYQDFSRRLQRCKFTLNTSNTHILNIWLNKERGLCVSV